MIINGTRLLKAKPIENMTTVKRKFEGTSFGLSEAGYDIRINQTVKFNPSSFWGGPMTKVYTQKDQTPEFTGKTFKSRFVLASAIEKFQMPEDLVGVVHDKSTWARKGLSVFNTVIEPGWNGFLTLELVFHGNEPVTIHRGQGIAQVLFSRLDQDSNYGNGKYQNQENRPVQARH